MAICQSCNGSNLTEVFFAGWIPLVNTFRKVDAPHTEQARYPAQLFRCADCTLVQMGTIIDPGIVFPKDYAYRSGTTQLLRDNFADLAREVGEVIGEPLKASDYVLDIASNDGTLLKAFRDRYGCQVMGVEPTDAVDDSLKGGVPTMCLFWGDRAASYVSTLQKVVTACNVSAHVPDPQGFLKAVDKVLAPGGVFVLEVHYLPEMMRTLQYDTCYHEHLRFYSLTSLRNLLQRNGFEVFRAKQILTHGGSLRVYCRRASETKFVDSSVSEILRSEEGVYDWNGFNADVAWSKHRLWAMLEVIKRSGARIFGIGCPSRAVVLIHYTGMDHNTLDCVCEVPDSPKINHYVPGTAIPVVDEERLYAEQPEYVLLLSWHLAMELAIKLRVRGYKGRFIVPLPEPKILEGV